MVRHLFELFTRNQTRGISHGKLSTGMCACQRVIQNALGSIWRRLGVDLYHPSPPGKKKPGSTTEQQKHFSDEYTTRYQPCLTELTFSEDTGTNVFLWGSQSPSTFQQPCFTLRKYENKVYGYVFFHYSFTLQQTTAATGKWSIIYRTVEKKFFISKQVT